MQRMRTILAVLVLMICATVASAEVKGISVELTVPDATWSVVIEEVHQVQNELWVIATVSQDPDIMGAQVISTVEASLEIEVPDLPIRYFVIGKTWTWDNAEPYAFVAHRAEIDKALETGRRIYPSDIALILNKTWQWESTTTPVERVTVSDPGRYTIRLAEEGVVQARLDCNRGRGRYRISPGRLSFGPLASTRMACSEDSLSGLFMRDLPRVVSFFVEDGWLYLELPYDSGTMKFRQVPVE